MKLSDELFEFRGPVVISNVTKNVYLNRNFDAQQNIFPKPILEDGGMDLLNKEFKEHSALNDLIKIQTLVANQIKNIEEPKTLI